MKLSPYKREEIDDRFTFVPVARPWDEVLQVLRGRTPPKGLDYADPRYYPCRRLVRTTGSVVYFPYFRCISGASIFWVDALNGRVVNEQACNEDDELGNWPDPHLEFGQIDVDFHRCPTCGVDLPSQQSHIYICKNCDSVVSLEKEKQLSEGILMSGDIHTNRDPLFPFWSFKLHHKTLRQIAKGSVTGPPPDRLVIPAFRIANFKVLRRLVQRITTAYPRFEKERVEGFNRHFRPVDISAAEAKTLAEICIFCEKAKREPNLSPESIDLKPQGVELFYAPFRMQSYFYVDSILNAVTFARNTVDN